MKNIARFLTVILVAGGLAYSGGEKVSALSCRFTSLPEYIESMDAIFVGKVIDSRGETADASPYATFQVEEYWKGDIGSTVTVGAWYWTGLPYPPAYFQVGERYLVFGIEDSVDSSFTKGISVEMMASIACGRTKLLSGATEEREALGPGKKLVQPTSPSPVTPTVTLKSEPKPKAEEKNQDNKDASRAENKGAEQRSVVAKFVLWFKSLFR